MAQRHIEAEGRNPKNSCPLETKHAKSRGALIGLEFLQAQSDRARTRAGNQTHSPPPSRGPTRRGHFSPEENTGPLPLTDPLMSAAPPPSSVHHRPRRILAPLGNSRALTRSQHLQTFAPAAQSLPATVRRGRRLRGARCSIPRGANIRRGRWWTEGGVARRSRSGPSQGSGHVISH